MIEFFKKNSYNVVKMLLTQVGLAMLAIIMSMATHTNNTAYLVTSFLCTAVYLYVLYLMVYELGQKDKPAIDGGRATLQPLKGFWISFCANIPNIICGIMAVVFFFFLAFQQPVEVFDANGDKIDVYVKTNADTNEFDKIYLFSDNGVKATTVEKENYRESQVKGIDGTTTSVYDKSGNEIILYTESGESISVSANNDPNAISDHWASNLHAVPLIISTFFQMTYFGIKSELFGNSHYIYLFTPFVSVFFCAIGYYFGATGKRMLFFLPEMKRKPPKNR